MVVLLVSAAIELATGLPLGSQPLRGGDYGAVCLFMSSINIGDNDKFGQIPLSSPSNGKHNGKVLNLVRAGALPMVSDINCTCTPSGYD